jgi:hypothetical protein
MDVRHDDDFTCARITAIVCEEDVEADDAAVAQVDRTELTDSL